MAKVAKGATAPPKKQAGRKSVRQAEILSGLEMLKAGKGETIEDEKGREYLVVELDKDQVVDVKKAEAAIFNLRWKLNPVNKVTEGNQAEFDRLFTSAGHGGLKVYADDGTGKIMLAALKSYAGATAPAAKKSTAKPTTAKKPNGNGGGGNGGNGQKRRTVAKKTSAK